MLRIRSSRDLALGGLFVAVGLFGLWSGAGLRLGTAIRMGPGYLPLILCYLLAGLGILIVLRGFLIPGPRLETWRLRPLLCVLVSVSFFALSIQRLGIVLTTLAAVAIAAPGDPTFRRREIFLLAGGLAIFSAAVFVVALGLPMPLWPPFLTR